MNRWSKRSLRGGWSPLVSYADQGVIAEIAHTLCQVQWPGR